MSVTCSRFRGVSISIFILAVSLPAQRAYAHATEMPKAKNAVIYAGHLIAIPGDPSMKDVSIVIKSGIVDRVVPGFISEDDVKSVHSGTDFSVIDLKDKWVLPGLVDSHVHFASMDKSEILTRSEAYISIFALANARKTLEAGFTTVRDLGAAGNVVNGVRDAIAAGHAEGPRIITGAYLSKAGSQGDYLYGSRKEVSAALSHLNNQCIGVVDCEKKVRELHKYGSNGVKVVADFSTTKADPASFHDEEMQAIVSTAHDLGMVVGAHAHSLKGIRSAVSAGVDSIEHGTFSDKETTKAMKSSGVYFVPTLLGMEKVREMIPGFPEEWKVMWKPAVDAIGETLRSAQEQGVRIVFGTDAGVFPHGENAKEFPLMMKYGNMTTREVLATATLNAAELLNLEGKVGVVKSGSYADIIAVDENPYEKIEALSEVKFVMKDGVTIVRR